MGGGEGKLTVNFAATKSTYFSLKISYFITRSFWDRLCICCDGLSLSCTGSGSDDLARGVWRRGVQCRGTLARLISCQSAAAIEYQCVAMVI